MLVVVALLGLAAGLLAGVTAGPLWLDEALTVEIATLPLNELQGALRVDGSPPVYYLLLHGWTAVFGTGTVVVRLLTVAMVPAALWLCWRLGHRLGGTGGGRGAVVVLAALPWTTRFGSETRMYTLVVVLVLAGALALLAIRSGRARGPVVALALLTVLLLLTHYWSLFLLAAVGLWHLPGALRRRPEPLRVVLALTAGGLLFLPWLPTFVFQALHTGAPWASPPGVVTLLRTPTFWGGGALPGRIVLAVLLVALAVVGARASRAGRALALVALATLGLAWTQTAVLGGAYTGRYTAVAVPVVAVAAGLGAASLRQRRSHLILVALVAVGLGTGVPAATVARTSAGDISTAVRAAAPAGSVVGYCPDQLAPAVQRLLGPSYEQVVYPTLGPPERIDWVDYEDRQDAADPVAIAGRLDALAGTRDLLVLSAGGFRTYDKQCETLVAAVAALRGPPTVVFGKAKPKAQRLYRFG